MNHFDVLENKIDDLGNKLMLLFEHMDAKFDLVFEILSVMNNRMDTLATTDELNAVAKDVTIVKNALTETNRELRWHDKRLTKLERKVFE